MPIIRGCPNAGCNDRQALTNDTAHPDKTRRYFFWRRFGCGREERS